jgi:hypothetical protein
MPVIVIEAPPFRGAESKATCVMTGELNVNVAVAVPSRLSTATNMPICMPKPGVGEKQATDVEVDHDVDPHSDAPKLSVGVRSFSIKLSPTTVTCS